MHHDHQVSIASPAGSIRSLSRVRTGKGIPDRGNVGDHVPVHLLHQPGLQSGLERVEGLACGQKVCRRAGVQCPDESVNEAWIDPAFGVAGRVESAEETEIGGRGHDVGLWLQVAPTVYRGAR